MQMPIKRRTGSIVIMPQKMRSHPSVGFGGVIVNAIWAALKNKPEAIAKGIANNPTTHPIGVGVSSLFTFGYNMSVPLS
jgi:hypothetical protein